MGLIEDLMVALAPNEADAAQRNPILDQQQARANEQRWQINQRQLQQADALQPLKQAILEQQLKRGTATAQTAQTKANVPPPMGVQEIIKQAYEGGSPTSVGSPSQSGNQYSIEGDTKTPFNMNRANERIRGILDALKQGQAPQANANLPQMTATSLSPVEGSSSKAPFALKGYGGQMGFDPTTGAFTNRGIGADAEKKPGAAAGSEADHGAPGSRQNVEARVAYLDALAINRPKLSAAERQASADQIFGKEIGVDKLSKLYRYDSASKSFQPAPADLSESQAKTQGYRFYDQKQRDSVSALTDVHEALSQLRGSVADIKDKNAFQLMGSQITGGNLGFGPEGAVFEKSKQNFTTVFDKFLGGVRAAASPQMQTIRNKVLPNITSSDAVSDRLMGDLTKLIDVMGESKINAALGNQSQHDGKLIAMADQLIQTAKESGAYKYEKGEAAKGTPPPTAPPNMAGSKPLDQGTAAKFLNQAGGDKNKARELAKTAGFSF